MANKRSIESADERYARYDKAQTRILSWWHDHLEDAYRYIIPNKEIFDDTSPGDSKMNEIFDMTAVNAAQQFANNFQTVLMPPFQRWVTLVAGDLITKDKSFSDDEKRQINEKLQEDTETFFDHLNSSNFNLVVNESFWDLVIGTAVIIVNEGDLVNPFSFDVVPMAHVAFEEGTNQELDSFWRRWTIPLRQVNKLWPQAVLPENFQNQLKTAPDTEITFIEGTIHYPNNDPGSEFFYYVQIDQNRQDIFSQFFEYNPFTGFRYAKTPGEILGRGPGLNSLGFIKVLNKASEFYLRSVKLQAIPAYTTVSTAFVNPYNVRIEPGALISINPEFAGNPPIQPISTGGVQQSQALLQFIQSHQSLVKENMFADPLGDIQETPNKTATEISIRQQNFVRQNAAAASRLATEFINPIVQKCIAILRKKALITDIQTSQGTFEYRFDNKSVAIDYRSPLADIQNQQDVQQFQAWMQLNMGLYQEYGILAAKMFKVPQWTGEKLNIDASIINDEVALKQIFENITQQFMQGQQQGDQQQQQPGGQQAALLQAAGGQPPAQPQGGQ